MTTPPPNHPHPQEALEYSAVSSRTICAPQVFNGRGRACSPFQGYGIEYFLLYGRGILDVRGGHTWSSRVWLCSYAATSSLESSEVSLAVLTQRSRIQALSISVCGTTVEDFLGNERSHHPDHSYAGVFICVSNSILFVCYNIYIVSVSCMFDVSSHLLYPLSTLLSTDQLIAFAILD